MCMYSNNLELQPRIRFMLKDVIEQRENNWRPRDVLQEVLPKTIAQVREEAAIVSTLTSLYTSGLNNIYLYTKTIY